MHLHLSFLGGASWETLLHVHVVRIPYMYHVYVCMYIYYICG